MSKILLSLVISIILISLILLSATALASTEKEILCHVPPKIDLWKEVEKNAVTGHLGHGDWRGLPGTSCGGVDFCSAYEYLCFGPTPVATIMVQFKHFLPIIFARIDEKCNVYC